MKEKHLAGDPGGNVVGAVAFRVEIDDDNLPEVKVQGKRIATSTLPGHEPPSAPPVPGRFSFRLSRKLLILILLSPDRKSVV